MSLLLVCAPLVACSGPGIRFETRDSQVREVADELVGFARQGWALPLDLRVYFSNADDGQALPPEAAASERRAALAQLQELRRAYARSPFDLFTAEVALDPGLDEPRASFDGKRLALRIEVPPAKGEAPPRVVPAGELLDVWAEDYRWERDARWYAGEKTVELRRALKRDLVKLQQLDDQLGKECRRLELLAGSVRWRAATSTADGQVHLTPSDAAFARAAQFRAMYALYRVLNTLARWRPVYLDPACSLRDDALPALVYARYLHEAYLGWLLNIVVGGRTTTKVWRRDWWHRNALYQLLDGEAELVALEPGKAPGRVPEGSVRALLSLRLDGDLYDWFDELDAAWKKAPRRAQGPLEAELAQVLARLKPARARAEKRRGSAFTAWKELWDARLKNGFSFPFYAVVKGVAEWLGDTRIQHPHPAVTKDQLARLAKLLRPGDVILERADHYLSNAFLPGFWPHAILYLGPEQAWTKLKLPGGGRLGDDPLVKEILPKFRAPALLDHGKARVIEAVSEGVVFSSLEHAVRHDYVVVLRPLLSEAERARGIRAALALHGRPYDFDFDFQSDDKIVCTELVYRAYDDRLGFRVAAQHPAAGKAVPGVLEVMGRQTMPANQIARYAVYMADHPQPNPAIGYPGKKLQVLVVLDRSGKEVPRTTWYDGAAALAELRKTVDR